MRPTAILLATALPLLPALCAQEPAPQATPPSATAPSHGHGLRGDRMAQLLGLSPEQQSKLAAIREKHAASMKADREAAHAKAAAFRAAMEDPKISEAQLRQAFDQLNAGRFQSLLDRRAMRQEMRAVLTPEQQAKADELKAAFRERIKARMQERRAAWRERASSENN